MQVIGIPKEDKNSASTRIRYYAFLENSGLKWETYDGKMGDVLYIQKKADPETRKLAKKVKGKVPIVYDIDDFPVVKKGVNRIKMLRLADVVITDTEERSHQLEELFGIKAVIIPDCIDYKPNKRVVIRDKIEKVVTFGNKANVMITEPYMKKIPYEKYCITNKKVISGCDFIKWELSSIVKNLMDMDLCVLAHRNEEKSNNRLLVAMSIGLPALVSDTASYRRTMEDAGCEELIVNENNITGKMNMSKDYRKKTSDLFYEYSWKYYHPEISGEKLAKVLNEAIG